MAVIYCFTSTGNSLYAARKIADEIDAKVLPVTYETTTTDEDVIGFVFPIFFWGLPNMVRHFAENIRITNPDAYVFAVATFGSAAPGAVSEINKYLRDHRLSYAASIKSVENYLPMYELEKVDEGIAAAEQSIDDVAHDIAERRHKGGGLFWLPNHIVKMTFPGKHGDCDKKFTVSDGCTGCGICAKVCPAKNITVSDGRPAFQHRCEHCITCVHCCPSNAIDYGKTKGRARYVHPEIGVNGLIEFWRHR